MKIYIKNEVTLQNELVTISEDPWAYVYALPLFGFVVTLFGGALAMFL